MSSDARGPLPVICISDPTCQPWHGEHWSAELWQDLNSAVLDVTVQFLCSSPPPDPSFPRLPSQAISSSANPAFSFVFDFEQEGDAPPLSVISAAPFSAYYLYDATEHLSSNGLPPGYARLFIVLTCEAAVVAAQQLSVLPSLLPLPEFPFPFLAFFAVGPAADTLFPCLEPEPTLYWADEQSTALSLPPSRSPSVASMDLLLHEDHPLMIVASFANQLAADAGLPARPFLIIEDLQGGDLVLPSIFPSVYWGIFARPPLAALPA
jgi:hypothetical protein